MPGRENKIPNNSHQGPAASAASGVNKIGFWPAKDCPLLQTRQWTTILGEFQIEKGILK